MPTDKPSFATLEKAMGEFKKNGVVQDTRCERCGDVLQVIALSATAWTVNCQCGLYCNTLRGL